MMTSSLSIAVAGRAARAELLTLAHRLLIVTFALGALFLILKGFEYRDDIEKHLFPGPDFPLRQRGAALFFSFYWIMTGVHALHVTGGLAAVMRLIVASRRHRTWLSGSSSEEATALYIGISSMSSGSSSTRYCISRAVPMDSESSLWRICRAHLLTWIALCVLLGTTFALARVPLGWGNLPVSLVIAGLKSALVGAIFMRLSENNPVNRLAASAGPIWVFVMFVLLGTDYLTR